MNPGMDQKMLTGSCLVRWMCSCEFCIKPLVKGSSLCSICAGGNSGSLGGGFGGTLATLGTGLSASTGGRLVGAMTEADESFMRGNSPFETALVGRTRVRRRLRHLRCLGDTAHPGRRLVSSASLR